MENQTGPVIPEHLMAKPMPGGGYTYALASWLGYTLRTAEGQYGARDMSFTILGCEFADSNPQVWFPGFHDGRKHVVVQLSPHAFAHKRSLLWELAHETVHLLDPAPYATNLFEEGIATTFARDFMLAVGCAPFEPADAYAEAVRLVDELEQSVPGAARLLREKAGRWRDVTPEVFLEVAPGYDPQKVERLVGTFVRS